MGRVSGRSCIVTGAAQGIGHALATFFRAPANFNAIPMVGGHVALAFMLVTRFRQLDPESMPSIKKFYKHIWDLFYLEYALYTLI